MTGIMYSDFFDAPRTVEKPVGKSKKAKVMEPKGKKGKKGKGVTFDEEEEEKDVADDAREVMGRFKEDLFADDEEEEVENDQRMSSIFPLRLCELSAHIQQCRRLKRGRKP
jgi:U3 small nucleolar ribonucleoprotein component